MTREEQSVKMGKRLKALREETPLNGKKMSHEKLKEKLKEIYGVEISRDSLMNYEVSDVNHSKFGTNLKMNVEYLNCLSSFYGVSTDYLLGRSDAKTANEDISKQRKKGYKGKRFVICPKLVNKNQGKTKIVEKIWNKKFNQYVPKHWARSADCEVHKKKIQVKPKWEYHIIAIKKL